MTRISGLYKAIQLTIGFVKAYPVSPLLSLFSLRQKIVKQQQNDNFVSPPWTSVYHFRGMYSIGFFTLFRLAFTVPAGWCKSTILEQGGNFLKKPLCCVGGNVEHKIWIYQLSWLGILATVKRLKADVSSVSPSSEWTKELWVALGLYGEWWSYTIGTWKKIQKLMNN